MSRTRSRWEAVRSIPDAEIWAARCDARARAAGIRTVKQQQDRLLRGEQTEYVRAIAESIDPGVLTFGFARRLATYKRLNLLTHDPERLRSLSSATVPSSS